LLASCVAIFNSESDYPVIKMHPKRLEEIGGTGFNEESRFWEGIGST
jgi:hypothetical protein